MDEVSIMQICKSSFNDEEIRKSKVLLFESLDIIDSMPSRRRDEKGERSLQDIIRVFKETDPDDVPTFVAKDLRKLPPVTFDHVDVSRLLKDITTLKASMTEMQFKMDVSYNTIGELRAEIVELRNIIAVCRSPENASKTNVCRQAHNASRTNDESAKSDSTLAAVIGSNVLPPPAFTSPVVQVTSGVSTSTTRHAYAAAVKHPPIQKARLQVYKKPQGVPKNTSSVPPVPAMGQIDKEGFVKVERKRKKPSSRNQCGTALSGPNMLLRSAIPSTQLYVSRLHHSTKVEEIMEYLRVKTNWTLRVEKLESRHNVNFTSFVVRVPTHHLETFMKEEFWPKGVVFRRFRGRLSDTMVQRNTAP